jgi:hypothetical protein
MWLVWETGRVHIVFWLGDLKKDHHLEVVGVDGKIM